MAALAGALSWLSSLASSLLTRVAFGAKGGKKEVEEEEDAETLPTTTATTGGTVAAGAKREAPWLSRLFRRE